MMEPNVATFIFLYRTSPILLTFNIPTFLYDTPCISKDGFFCRLKRECCLSGNTKQETQNETTLTTRNTSSSSFGTTTLCGFLPSQPGLSKFFCPQLFPSSFYLQLF